MIYLQRSIFAKYTTMTSKTEEQFSLFLMLLMTFSSFEKDAAKVECIQPIHNASEIQLA